MPGSIASTILRPIVYIDSECDGIDPTTTCITEFALRKAGSRQAFPAYISKPEYPNKANNPSSFSKTIPLDKVRVPFQWAMEKMTSFFNNQTSGKKSAVMGFNVHGWDKPVFENNCRRFGGTLPPSHQWQWFDLANVAQALGYPRGTTQQQLEVGLKLDPKKLPLNRHRAFADILVVKKIWERMTQNIEENKQALQELETAFDAEEPENAVAEVLKRYDPTLIPTEEAIDLIHRIKTAEKAHRLPIVVLYDLETTGLFQEGKTNEHYNEAPRIVQFAAKILSPYNETFQSLVNPETPIPFEATNIHHITDDMVAGAPKFQEVWEQFETWVKASQTFAQMVAENKKNTDWEPQIILVGYNNARFDNILLEQEVRRTCGIDIKREFDKGVKKTWDAMPLMSSWYAGVTGEKPANNKLQTHAEHLGFEKDNAHTAMGDVRTLERVLNTICDPLHPATVIKHCVAEDIQFKSPGVGFKEVIQAAQTLIERESQESQEIDQAIKLYREKAVGKAAEKKDHATRKRKASDTTALPDTQAMTYESQENNSFGGTVVI